LHLTAARGWDETGPAAGHPGRMPPTQAFGPYAAMVDDPDGNVVLLTSDEAARVDKSDA